jgi:hypothetical protein
MVCLGAEWFVLSRGDNQAAEGYRVAISTALVTCGNHEPVLGGALLYMKVRFMGWWWFIFLSVPHVCNSRHLITLLFVTKGVLKLRCLVTYASC